jgi:hypothetical protein
VLQTEPRRFAALPESKISLIVGADARVWGCVTWSSGCRRNVLYVADFSTWFCPNTAAGRPPWESCALQICAKLLLGPSDLFPLSSLTWGVDARTQCNLLRAWNLIRIIQVPLIYWMPKISARKVDWRNTACVPKSWPTCVEARKRKMRGWSTSYVTTCHSWAGMSQNDLWTPLNIFCVSRTVRDADPIMLLIVFLNLRTLQ